MTTEENRRALYPPIEPNESGMLDVGDGHEIYYEECGNPDGKPAVFLHGGPGGGSTAAMRRFWNPDIYRIILFDQRGSGKSTPHASLENNTTWDLVADIERLREHLGIDRWSVFGGSWGSTLGLAYAETHPDKVKSLIVRGVFLARPEDIDWFYGSGANRLFPEAWQSFLEAIPEPERVDLLSAYEKRLTDENASVRLDAAIAWSRWEGTTSRLYPQPEVIAAFSEARFAEALARIECHYFRNGSFLRGPNQLLDEAHRLKGIPGAIVQGRYDAICPPEGAFKLHQAWPDSEWVLVPDAGHAATEPGITHALIEATDKMLGRLA